MSTNLKYIASKYLYLTTENRINSSPINGAQILFPQNLLKGSNTNEKKILKINLQDLQVNREWYNIQNYRNNQFLLNGSPIFLIEGNPSVYALRDMLNNLMTGSYVVTYDITQNKFIFNATDSVQTFQPVNCGSFLGLREDTLYVGTFESEFPINMQYEHSLYFQADFATTANNLDNICNPATNVSSILAKIPIRCAPFDDICFSSLKNINEALEIATYGFDTASFYLITDRGYRPKLNHNYTFSIKLEIYQEE